MRTTSILMAVALVVMGLTSCKRKCHDVSNPDCEGYDPCYGKVRTSAAFKVEEHLTPFGTFMGEDIWIESDSVNGSDANHVIRFTAQQEADSFIWTIGSQNFYTKRVIQYGFPQDRNIPIQLIVINKHTDNKCFPDDDGRDTVVKYIYVWKANSNDSMGLPTWKFYNLYPITGYFKGYYKSNPNKEVKIRIWDSLAYTEAASPPWLKATYYENIPDGYHTSKYKYNATRTSAFWSVPFAGYDQCDVFNYTSKDTLVRTTFLAQLLKDRKTIKIKLQTYNLWTDKTTKNDEFTGTKL